MIERVEPTSPSGHTGHGPVLLPCPLAGAKQTFDRRRHQQFESTGRQSDSSRTFLPCRSDNDRATATAPLLGAWCDRIAQKPQNRPLFEACISPRQHDQCDRQTVDAMQASNSYRGFESDALRQRGCTWGVVPACVARKAPQWGLSFVERPPENGPSVPERANSPNFLWGVMVEWSFVRQDDQMSMDEPRDYFQWKSEQPLRVRILTGGAMNHVHFRGVKRTCCDHPSMSALTQSGHGGLAETSPARLDFRGLCGTVLQTMHLVPPVGGSAIGA